MCMCSAHSYVDHDEGDDDWLIAGSLQLHVELVPSLSFCVCLCVCERVSVVHRF